MIIVSACQHYYLFIYFILFLFFYLFFLVSVFFILVYVEFVANTVLLKIILFPQIIISLSLSLSLFATAQSNQSYVHSG